MFTMDGDGVRIMGTGMGMGQTLRWR